MTLKFVTIFPYAQNVHLIKDVGQIGNALAENFDIESTLVCYHNSETYDYLNTEATFQKIDFIENKGLQLFLERSVINYLKQKSRSIDVLHFFHLTKETIYYSLLYKRLNPKGILYIKMDANDESISKQNVYSKNFIFQTIHKAAEKRLFKKLNWISAENPNTFDQLNNTYPVLKNKTLLIPNGINTNYIKTIFPTIKPFSEKENIILSVGRIGAEDKGYDILLNAFVKANIPNWKLVLVGPILNNFDKKVEQIAESNPEFKDKIELTGNITDRANLYSYYNNSKIFCLSSPKESFGIAFVEALYFGNYIIGTNGMSSFQYISNGLKFGKSVAIDNVSELSKTLQDCSNDNYLSSTFEAEHKYAQENFSWNKIITLLANKLLS